MLFWGLGWETGGKRGGKHQCLGGGGKVGGQGGDGITELFGGLGWEGWGVHRRMGKHRCFGVEMGRLGVSTEGWDHSVVLG